MPLQVKEYPGFNIIGLLFGPGGENQKRLEKVRSLFCHFYKIVLMICEFLSTILLPCSHLLPAFQETGAKIQVYGNKAETGEKVFFGLKKEKY